MKQVWQLAICSRLLVLFLAIVFKSFGSAYDNSSSSSFISWDAVYFKKLALTGSWDYEHEFAFFPGYPLMVRALAGTIYMIFGSTFCSWESLILYSGLAISNISFILASVMLFKLSKQVKMSEKFCQLTSLAYILNPSAIFMSSLYTESLFSLLSFSGMYYYSKKSYFKSCLLFILCGAVRANGLLYAGFFIFIIISNRKISSFTMIKMIIYSILTLVPFLSFQYLGKKYFCLENPQPWCDSQFIYSFIQKHYWNNGWMAYYELKQIPNFIIASPFLIISIYGIALYIKADPRRFMTLGYKSLKHKDPYLDTLVLPYFYLWSVMLFVVTTLMHVQVILRFFTSLPPLYWTMAGILQTTSFKSRLLQTYLLVWSLVGIVLFSNFYPPA